MDSFKETDEEIEVRKEDQERINEFGVLHKTLAEMNEDVNELRAELEYIEDAEQEVMLSGDSSGKFLVQLGSTYVSVEEDEFNDYLETKREGFETRLSKAQAQIGELEAKKMDLKSELYSRFGKTINLDD